MATSDVTSRIAAAFTTHDIDPQKGRSITERRLASLEQLGAPQEIVDTYRRNRRDVIFCCVYDEDDLSNHIEFMLWPREPILVSFMSDLEEESCFALVERLALALDYKVDRDTKGDRAWAGPA